MKRLAVSGLLLLLLVSGPAWSGEWDVSGSAGGELRLFTDDPQFPEQRKGVQSSTILTPEVRYVTAGRKNQLSVIPFYRLDSWDDDRTHFDLREAYWRYTGNEWEFLAGLNKIFWGVAESRHLVDVINQTDSVEDIDEEDKLGQPMVNVVTQRGWGRISFFVLPFFRERTFPGEPGRLRTPLPVDEDAAEFESSREEHHVDFAARYSHYLGNWDIGAYYFYGTGREPRLVPSVDGSHLEPRYDLIHQVGVDLQYTREAWLWKVEGIGREGQGDTFGAGVGGFEYTLYQIFDSSADLGLLVEYLYDGRDEQAPVTAFDDDIFLGTRLAFNDPQDTQILLGAIIDRENQSIAGTLEAERRFGEHVKLELESRWFAGVDQDDPSRVLQDDSFTTLRTSWFF